MKQNKQSIRFGTGSPASFSKQISAKKAEETRKHIEETMLELRARKMTFSGKIQKEIENIRSIDRLEPVDRRARMRACRFLKMYLGQYRVVRAMSENIEMINDELEIREMTEDFDVAVNEINGLIKSFDCQKLSPPRLFDRLRKVMAPLQNGSRLSEYDKMYDELIQMYPDDQDADGISDSWLEGVISGRIAWDSAPMTKESEHVSQPEQVEQTRVDENKQQTAPDIQGMLDALNDALKGAK